MNGDYLLEAFDARQLLVLDGWPRQVETHFQPVIVLRDFANTAAGFLELVRLPAAASKMVPLDPILPATR